jgi:Na+-transporting NADH:ubiquinone oxidoreductase subunit NqrC
VKGDPTSRVLIVLVVLSLAVVTGVQSRAQVPAAPSPAAVALTDEQKTVYALGLIMQRSLRQFDLSAEEIEIIKRALTDGAAGAQGI